MRFGVFARVFARLHMFFGIFACLRAFLRQSFLFDRFAHLLSSWGWRVLVASSCSCPPAHDAEEQRPSVEEVDILLVFSSCLTRRQLSSLKGHVVEKKNNDEFLRGR